MRFVWKRPWACILFSLLIGANNVSAWTPDEPTGQLTLAKAVAVTLARNPDLAVATFELKASDARILQAGLRPNPDLAFELEDFAGTGAVRGAKALQGTLRLSQVIELGAKREHRLAVAGFDRELTGIERQARDLDALAEVTRRFIDVVAAQEQVTLAREAAELSQRTARAIETRVRAARSPEAELSRARIAVLRARIEERQARSAFSSARRSLAASWGGTEAHFDAARADLFDLPNLDSFEKLREQLDRNPDLTRFASEGRLRDAQWRLAQAQARPSLTWGVGVRRYEATNDIGLVAGFAIALPVSDRNQGAIAEARVRRQQSRAEEQAARIRIQAAVYALYQQVVAGREQLTTLRVEAIPQAQAALEQTQYGYERGRFSYLELAAAQQDLLGLRAGLIGIAADSNRLTAEIERLTSAPLARQPNEMETLP